MTGNSGTRGDSSPPAWKAHCRYCRQYIERGLDGWRDVASPEPSARCGSSPDGRHQPGETGGLRLLGQDDWLFFARRDDGTLVYAVTEADGHWLDSPHGGGCWDPATGLNCDGETRFTCRRDCAWMRDHVAAHLDEYDWAECGHDPVSGEYLGWPPEKDAEFEAASRERYLPRDHGKDRPARAARRNRTMAHTPGLTPDRDKQDQEKERSRTAKAALNTRVKQWQKDRESQDVRGGNQDDGQG
jgi:hypothetical protein